MLTASPILPVPEQLRGFCRSHQDAAYDALFQAAADAIKKLALDPRFIGTDLPGFTSVLHTWGRQMQYHPHLHLIVPAGGVSPDRKRWLASRNNFYLPVRALSQIFRAKFKDEMFSCNLLAEIDPSVWQMDWNVNSQSIGDCAAALKYLAPYIFRVAISNSRIIDVKDRSVSFSYRKKGSNRLRHATLDVLEFIRRFLQHVLPAGFMKVRHYGFMSASCALTLARLRLLILEYLKELQFSLDDLAPSEPKPPMPKPVCPSCGGALLYLFSLIPGKLCRGST
jgi:hypothetical protein